MSFKRRLLLTLSTWTVAIGVAASNLDASNPYHLSQSGRLSTMRDCMRCHDRNGPARSTISVCLGDNCLYTKNHPLMQVYPPAGMEGEFATLTEVERAGCLLEDGRITCLSCHDLAKPPPHLILDGDKLCLICHKY